MNFNLRRCLWVLLSLLGTSAGFAAPGSITFSPLSGYPQMPSQITISGTSFATGLGNNVRFNGVLAASSSPALGQIQAAVPFGATTGRISVENGSGTGQSLLDFVIGPFIESFSPFSGDVGTVVTINGAQFLVGPTFPIVKFNGSNALIAVFSDNQMQALVPTNAMTGPLTISITNGLAIGTNITITNFFVSPTITSFSPPSAKAGSNITIVGRSFAGLTAVRVGNVNATIVSSSQTNIIFTVPNNAVTGKISVDAPPNSTLTASNFVVLPTIVSFTPPKGRTGTNVVITGTGFSGSAANIIVKFNGIAASAIVGTPSATSITAIVAANTTSGPITVTTTNGTATSDTNFFLPPSITSLSTPGGPALTPVVITGVNFTNATDVSFGGVSAFFTVSNNTQITTVSPVGGATGKITVTTPGGVATNATLFSYPPIITSFTPNSGLPGTNVTINGVNFTNATAVKFAGSNASFTVVNDGKITATVPTNVVTGAITVTGPGGTGVSSSLFFSDTVSLTVQLLTNVISVTWPTSTLGFILQDTTNLLSTNTVWLAVTSPPVTLQNGVHTYTNVLDSSARYFRLNK